MKRVGRRALLGAAPLLMGAAREVPAVRPLSRMDLRWWRERHEAVLARLRHGAADLLLIGDSITQDLERRGPRPEMDFAAVWNRFHAPRHAVNLGFMGDTTASVIWRLRNGEAANVSPKVVQILIGANNFGRVRWGAEDTFAGIQAILAELRHRLPRTKIILLSVLPSRRSAWVDLQTETVNRMLAAHHKPGGDIAYVDVTRVFMHGGRLDTGAFYDGLFRPPEPLLHPSVAGWLRMAEMVEPTLSALMGDRPR